MIGFWKITPKICLFIWYKRELEDLRYDTTWSCSHLVQPLGGDKRYQKQQCWVSCFQSFYTGESSIEFFPISLKSVNNIPSITLYHNNDYVLDYVYQSRSKISKHLQGICVSQEKKHPPKSNKADKISVDFWSFCMSISLSLSQNTHTHSSCKLVGLLGSFFFFNRTDRLCYYSSMFDPLDHLNLNIRSQQYNNYLDWCYSACSSDNSWIFLKWALQQFFKKKKKADMSFTSVMKR